MLIISKKKDYYDGVVGTTGVDKSIVYERTYRELEENDKDFPEIFEKPKYFQNMDENPLILLWRFKTLKDNKYIANTPFIVGFCGKLYIGWKLHYEVKSHNDFVSSEVKTKIIYDHKVVRTLIEQKSWNKNLDDYVNYIKNYDALEIFREYNTPIFLYDYDYHYSKHSNQSPRFYVNPRLKDYKFYRVFDTFTAFQEIQMFISGVLGSGEKEIVEVEDKHKISQHGFDKWSFRKEPSKNK